MWILSGVSCLGDPCDNYSVFYVILSCIAVLVDRIRILTIKGYMDKLDFSGLTMNIGFVKDLLLFYPRWIGPVINYCNVL